MAGLEGLVRPFTAPNTLARRRLVAKRTKVEVTPARISWGDAGTLASAHQVEEIPQDGSFTVVKCDDSYQEVPDSRKVDVRRIEQVLERSPDGTPTKTNPDNFVDLERPYRVYFEKVELASQQRGITQTWTTAFDTAQFQTNNLNKGVCKQTFTLQRNLP